VDAEDHVSPVSDSHNQGMSSVERARFPSLSFDMSRSISRRYSGGLAAELSAAKKLRGSFCCGLDIVPPLSPSPGTSGENDYFAVGIGIWIALIGKPGMAAWVSW